MRKLSTLLLVGITLGGVGAMLYLTAEPGGTWETTPRPARSATPPPAGAEAPPDADAARPARTTAGPTAEKIARIKSGMTRAQVEGILGQCALAKTRYTPEGAGMRTAMWVHGDDLIGVCFRDGAVTTVMTRRLAKTPKAPPARPPEATRFGPATPATSKIKNKGSQTSEDLQKHLRELEKQFKKYDTQGLLEKLLEELGKTQ